MDKHNSSTPQEKQLTEKQRLEKEVERDEFILKEFEKKGLESYEKHKDLILEFVKSKLKENIEYSKLKLKESSK